MNKAGLKGHGLEIPELSINTVTRTSNNECARDVSSTLREQLQDDKHTIKLCNRENEESEPGLDVKQLY